MSATGRRKGKKKEKRGKKTSAKKKKKRRKKRKDLRSRLHCDCISPSAQFPAKRRERKG